MGESERQDRERWLELFERLPDSARGELIDFAEFLAKKAARDGEMTGEDRKWMDAAISDLDDRLAAIESDVPAEVMAAWLAKMSEGAVPVRYNHTGELEEVRP